MKSPNKQELLLASFLASQRVLELIENPSPETPANARCFTPKAWVLARRQLRQELAKHGEGEYLREARAVNLQLLSTRNNTGKIQIDGGLLCYGVRKGDGELVMATNVFRVQASFRCQLDPVAKQPEEGTPALPHPKLNLPLAKIREFFPRLRLEITSFQYESIH